MESCESLLVTKFATDLQKWRFTPLCSRVNVNVANDRFCIPVIIPAGWQCPVFPKSDIAAPRGHDRKVQLKVDVLVPTVGWLFSI
jgi:hypothetical protein